MKLVRVFIPTCVLQEEKIAGNIAEYYIFSFLNKFFNRASKAILYCSRVVSFPWRCDWSTTHTPPSQPIRYNTKPKWHLVTRVFPQFRQLCISWSRWSRWSPVHVRFPALQAAFHWLLVIFPKEGGEDGLRLKRLTQIADNIPENIFA